MRLITFSLKIDEHVYQLQLVLIPIMPHLEFCIGIEDHLSQVSDGSGIDDCLSQFWGVFTDVTEGGGSDSLQGEFWFLDTQHQ